MTSRTVINLLWLSLFDWDCVVWLIMILSGDWSSQSPLDRAPYVGLRGWTTSQGGPCESNQD